MKPLVNEITDERTGIVFHGRPGKLHSYPVDVLRGCETALIVFAAEFGGGNDAAWIAEAGLRATCVDENAAKLDAMRGNYPDDWEFIADDAYDFAGECAGGAYAWDVVSLDPFTNHFGRCADNIDVWCRLARRVVVIGTGVETTVFPPSGWAITDEVKRSDYDGGVWWTVVERT